MVRKEGRMMCGITAYWAKEAVLTRNEYDVLFEGAALRGRDGVGISIIYSDGASEGIREVAPYDEVREKVLDFVCGTMDVGSILLASFRATPETEPTTTIDMIQPLVHPTDNLYLVHNGGVTDSVKNSMEMSYDYETPLDSEAIFASYILNNNNMISAMENLSGSFAFVMVDKQKDILYAVTSFLPLAHSYVRGYGYFIHSSVEYLGKVLYYLCGHESDGVNVWESWYHHDLEGYSIYETDLQSGFQMRRPFKPRFLHPTWDSLADPGKRMKTFVVASGGIDSGLTAHLLKLGGHDVSMLHFNYGQKSEEAEHWAISRLSNELQIPYNIIDLKQVYRCLLDPSMLLEKNIKVTSGGDDIKSTIAWVAGRNAIFATLAMAFAETAILNYNYRRVWISAGWAQLSEETGGYPDNSYKFNKALEMLKRYGYITGHRIEFLPVLQNLTKTECWALGDALNFPFHYTVSCDNPQIYGGKPYLCIDCGSTKLSTIAADRAGIRDHRLFVNSKGMLISHNGKRLPSLKAVAPINPRDLINRLIINYEARRKLQEML
jgi:7-cyano-7-deazaguanine synthase